ncbi:MAG: sporulation transcriptional regulator SpoIIID [Oscillospiraceae bacterium]|nr:sporulation transcriptional regulator SpoIIID [Oscillospiraceae bacterium]
MIFLFVTTVHKDLTEKLRDISPSAYSQVKSVLETNKRERHIRGGLATKHKYEERQKKSK